MKYNGYGGCCVDVVVVVVWWLESLRMSMEVW